jgi:integrase
MVFHTQAQVLKTFGRTVGSVPVELVDSTHVKAFLDATRPPSRPGRFATINGFFRFAIQRHLLASSPLPTAKPKQPPYAKPYIYSAEELRRLLDATEELNRIKRVRSMYTIPPQTMRTLILLLYGAGLRASEGIGLTLDDVDLSANRLIIRHAKFDKTRLLPIGPKLAATLRLYIRNRNSIGTRPPSTTAVFLRRSGEAISRLNAEVCFALVRRRAGVARSDGAFFQPRLHDLRHTFAVHRLVTWYQAGANVQLLLPKLSTYLGHVGLAETQHYLTMTPELLREANQRFEHYAAPEVYHA